MVGHLVPKWLSQVKVKEPEFEPQHFGKTPWASNLPLPPAATVISPSIESFGDKLGLRPKYKKVIFLKTFFVEINGVTMLYAHDTKVEFMPAHMKESERGLQFESSFINNQT